MGKIDHAHPLTVDQTRQYVTLGLGRETFAVEVRVVREILDLCPISLVPNTPAFMLGMIDVRGQAVPVIDLRRKLGLPVAEQSDHTRILVMEFAINGRDLLIGMVADRVFEVTSLDEREISSPPEIGTRWKSDYIEGIGRRGENFVIILDLAHLFSSDETALIGPNG